MSLRVILILLVALLVLALLGLSLTFTPARLDTDMVDAPEQIAEPPTAPVPVRMSLIRSGEILAGEGFAYRGGNLLEKNRSAMTAVLVEHPQGRLLFDAGLGTGSESHFQTAGFLLTAFAELQAGKRTLAQLQEQGINQQALDAVVLSHVHWDHVSGLADITEVPVWLAQADLNYTAEGAPVAELMRQLKPELDTNVLEFSDGSYAGYEQSRDWFGDGSVVFVPIPGHTPGSTGMFVHLASGKKYFFVGDLVWNHAALLIPAERPWLARSQVDADAARVRRSIVQVYQLMQADPGLVVVPAHDAELQDKLATFPDYER